MRKTSQKDRKLRTPKQKRRLRVSSNKYLRPGALAQLRNSKAASTKCCTDLGKKRVAVLGANAIGDDEITQDGRIHHSPLVLSPEKFGLGSLGTPKTPHIEVCESESRLESLPMDVLVKILCHLHHDQLKAVFHVSQRIRKAVLLAMQFHFNYTTPERSRQEMSRTMTPLPTEHWPSVMHKGHGNSLLIPSPRTPKAPRHGPRPPSRVKFTEMRQIAAVLFQEPASFPSGCMVPSVLPKPMCKSLVSNRVLFYEDELCHAVAQNKLR